MPQSNSTARTSKRKSDALEAPDQPVPVEQPQQPQPVEQPAQPHVSPRRPFGVRRAEELKHTLQLCEDKHLKACLSWTEATYTKVFVKGNLVASRRFTLSALVTSTMNILNHLVRRAEMPEWLEQLFHGTDTLTETGSSPPFSRSYASTLSLISKHVMNSRTEFFTEKVEAYDALQRIFKAVVADYPVSGQSPSKAGQSGAK